MRRWSVFTSLSISSQFKPIDSYSSILSTLGEARLYVEVRNGQEIVSQMECIHDSGVS